MAGSYTFADIQTKIEADLDLTEETFITEDELVGYTNEAIRRAEQEILGIYEDYFLNKEPLALSSGISEYNLPADIYGHKIRKIIYQSGSIIYPIDYVHTKSWKFEQFAVDNQYPASQRYHYTITNDLTDGVKIVFFPPSQETSSTNVTIWYIRDARQLTGPSDTSNIDIPEAFNFIYAYVKMKCVNKENGGIAVEQAAMEFEKEKQLLVESLTARVVDDENTIEKDMTHYWESV